MSTLRLCGDEGGVSVYHGQMLTPAYGWIRIVPLYLLCVIPRTYDAIRCDRWMVDPARTSDRMESPERECRDALSVCGSRRAAAAAVVCVTGLLRLHSRAVLAAGCVLATDADPLYLPTTWQLVVLPDRSGLSRAVEQYLTEQVALLPPGSIFPATATPRPADADDDDTPLLHDDRRVDDPLGCADLPTY